MNIAWLGLGNMGMPMAEHLYAEGFPLVVYNRTAEKAHLFAAEKKDVRIATTPAEAALGADVIITMLADDQALKSVINGENGIFANSRKRRHSPFHEHRECGVDRASDCRSPKP